MESSGQPAFEMRSKTGSKTRLRQVIFPEILTSLATPGVILAALMGKVVVQSVQELGLLSEDMLRGDRLPVIHFPTDFTTADEIEID